MATRATAASAAPAGVGEPGRERRRPSVRQLSLTLVTLALVLVGCGGGDSMPKTLMDGSGISMPSVDLEGVSGDPVLTQVVVLDAREVGRGSRAADCLRERGSDPRPAARIVERVGEIGRASCRERV